MIPRRQQYILELIKQQEPAIVGAAVALVQGPPPALGAAEPPNMRTLATQMVAVATVAQAAQTGLNGKANAGTVQAMSQTLNTLKETAMPALQAEVAGKVSKAGDIVTGPLVVPAATATPTGKGAAPRFEQVLGGINSPPRTAQNVGNTPVALDALTDTTGLNRKVLPVTITWLITEAAPSTLLAVIGGTVVLRVGTTPGGSEVYSKTVSVGLLPGLLGKLAAGNEPPTAAVILNAGTVLYATATPSAGTNPGKWLCFVGSIFLPNAL